jgi:predicted phosphodiesterase
LATKKILVSGDIKIVVVSDMQIPYQDRTAVANLIQFVGDFGPDMLVNVGDDIDSPEVSHWNKGSAGEYAGTLQASLDELREVHGAFKDALGDKPYHVSRSNHGDRLRKYVSRYAPALAGLRALSEPDLMGYNELGIEYHREPFEIAPGWYAAHGDEGSLSAIAGRTAGLLAEKWGVSVVCGHTHRAGISSKTYALNGTVGKTVTGMEVGHLMDLSRAGYLAAGSADWQASFGLLYVAGGRVSPVLVPVHQDGTFTVEGVTYA